MKRHTFNLIEITIALGVIAIGIVAVIGAFPLAANKTRDAMAETYAAAAAADLLALIEEQGRGDWDTWFVGGSAYIGEGLPGGSDRTNFEVPGSCWVMPRSNDALWAYSTTASFVPGNKRFKIVRYVDANDNSQFDTGELVDFEAIMVVWREQVVFDGTNDLDYDIAVRLNAEISWPAPVPYTEREKAFYTTEFFKR